MPPPGGLLIVSVPRAASTRSTKPVSPVPRAEFAPPTPSSRTSTTRVSPSRSTFSTTSRACECLTTFVKASATMKYAVVSRAAGSRGVVMCDVDR